MAGVARAPGDRAVRCQRAGVRRRRATHQSRMMLSRWLVIVLGVVRGGWMSFDGIRALVAGDYLTPSAGPYAGQLGPWSKLVSYAGLDPRSTLMKAIFVVVGLATLLVAGALAMDV